ncbi:MAG TPA: YciI family protein [Vicinamibacterales bacterium]
MKTIAAIAGWLLAAVQAGAQQAYPPPADLQTFYIYFLNTGPNSGKGTPEERKEIQAQHMAHLNSLGAAGKIGGPFVNGGERRGLVILQAGSLEAARAIGEADPAVKAGTFTVEIHTLTVPGNWFEFGPVPEPFTMRRFVFFFLDDAPGRPADTHAGEMAKLQDAHLANLHRLSREGRLLLAGPLSGGGVHRGIGVMATEDVDEARRWMADDPLVKGGYLAVVPLQWFAADGILLRK